MTGPPLPHRARATLLGVLLPAIVLAGCLALVLGWRDRLPDQVTVHWGPGGVDRTGTPSDLILPMALLGGLSWLITAALCLSVGRTALTRRMVVGMSAGMAPLFGGLLVAVTAVQLDAPGPEQAGDPAAGIALALAAALLIGVAAALLAGADPPLPAAAPVPAEAARTDAPPGATWTGDASMVRPGLVWAVAVVLLAAGGATGALTGMWWLLVLSALLAALLLAMTGWRVQVDEDGLTATAQLGWPRQHIPAAEVERADVITLSPFSEFGGWGLRAAPDGRTGVVTRSGPAIQVQRTGGRVFVVTTSDAATGAALLNTVADRSRNRSRPAGD